MSANFLIPLAVEKCFSPCFKNFTVKNIKHSSNEITFAILRLASLVIIGISVLFSSLFLCLGIFSLPSILGAATCFTLSISVLIGSVAALLNLRRFLNEMIESQHPHYIGKRRFLLEAKENSPFLKQVLTFGIKKLKKDKTVFKNLIVNLKLKNSSGTFKIIAAPNLAPLGLTPKEKYFVVDPESKTLLMNAPQTLMPFTPSEYPDSILSFLSQKVSNFSSLYKLARDNNKFINTINSDITSTKEDREKIKTELEALDSSTISEEALLCLIDSYYGLDTDSIEGALDLLPESFHKIKNILCEALSKIILRNLGIRMNAITIIPLFLLPDLLKKLREQGVTVSIN